MSCIVLVGGGIGCGKTTFINYLLQNKNEIFGLDVTDSDNKFILKDEIGYNNRNSWKFYAIYFDSLCSIDEQRQLMKTLRGWRDFRVDLLMAVERLLIAFICKSEDTIVGPLSERSYKLFENLSSVNKFHCNGVSNAVIFIEDNFYYRSMRYDWFQIARRTNLGFATIFLHCPLNTAIYRNSTRGYHIPEEKIKKMFSIIEFPDPVKYKWEKYTMTFDSSLQFNNSSLSEVADVIMKAAKHPAEKVIMEDKIEAQKICSKNVIHQADRILRKIVSKKILSFKDVYTDENSLKIIVSHLVKIRQTLLSEIKQNCVHLPQDLVDKIQNLGVESVLEAYEEALCNLFNRALEEHSVISNLSNLQFKD